MESAEMNALEQYTEDERFPEWNDEAEYLFRTEYISKIKPLAEGGVGSGYNVPRKTR